MRLFFWWIKIINYWNEFNNILSSNNQGWITIMSQPLFNCFHLNGISYIHFNSWVGKLENCDIFNELLILVFNANIVLYPSIGWVLLLYYIAVLNANIVLYLSIGLVLLVYYIEEFSTSMVLSCMQKASIAHHCSTLIYHSATRGQIHAGSLLWPV